jgi:hypothetical protein
VFSVSFRIQLRHVTSVLFAYLYSNFKRITAGCFRQVWLSLCVARCSTTRHFCVRLAPTRFMSSCVPERERESERAAAHHNMYVNPRHTTKCRRRAPHKAKRSSVCASECIMHVYTEILQVWSLPETENQKRPGREVK